MLVRMLRNLESFCLSHIRDCVSPSVLMALVFCSFVQLRISPNKSSAFLGFYPEASEGLVQIPTVQGLAKSKPADFPFDVDALQDAE